jgi:hypothetical protein
MGATVARLAAALVLAAVTGLPRAPVALAAGERNACGCYQDEAGSCYCDKKAKCGCPGQCEPKGCEEQRQKQIEKEMQAEIKRAQDSARRKDGEKGDDTAGGAQSAAAPATEPAPRRAPRDKAAPARKLTAQQRRELSRLLELHVAERPEDATKSVEQLLRDLGPPAGDPGKRADVGH